MGAMDARNMYSNLAVNKYLHTVASCWISSNFIMPVYLCPSTWNKSTPTKRISIKFDIWVFLENLSKKVEFH